MRDYELKRLQRLWGSSWRRRGVLASIVGLLAVLLIIAACGEDATATPVPQATATPVPGVQPTATPVPQPTATPVPTTGLRPRSEWTEANPATLAEIEEELKKHRGESLVFVSWGGAYQAAQRQAYIEPFQNQFGIDIIEESPPQMAKLRTMAETGNIQWHVVDFGGDLFFTAVAANALDPLDYTVMNVKDYLQVVLDGKPYMGGGGITWSTLVAYNTEAFSQPMTSWDQFTDFQNFPGARAIHDGSAGIIPHYIFGLLAKNPDLVKTAEGRQSLALLTQEQEQEALDFWADFVAGAGTDVIFWKTGSDCPSLLISGDVTMCTAWNGRIFDAAKEGAPLAMCWECGHTLQTDVLVVTRGLKAQDPNKYELANLFIGWTSFPEINARMAKFITYGPMNTASLPLLDEIVGDPEVVAQLPSGPDNIGSAILLDEKWAGESFDRHLEAWLGQVLQQ